MRTRALPRPTPPTAPAPANDCAPARLDVYDLARLVADLAPLATVDRVSGLRSLYRDPRLHPAIHGTAPLEETPLDHAVDSGEVRRARIARRRLEALDPMARRVALWLVARADAVLDPRAWAYAYGRAEGPTATRHRDAKLTARRERAVLLLSGLQRIARGRLTEELALELDVARVAAEQLQHAAEATAAELTDWGTAAFADLCRRWFASPRRDPLDG